MTIFRPREWSLQSGRRPKGKRLLHPINRRLKRQRSQGRNQLQLQNYSDPMKTLQQEVTRSDINEKTAKIEAKKQQIEADKQAISDAEDELRKSGGDVGWSR
jgi:chromosome segregation ATPase